MDLADLLEPYVTELSSAQLAQVSTYLDLLLRWNAKMNLTAIRDAEQIVRRHFGESFFLASHLFGSADFRLPFTDQRLQILDLGSGAGFPAVPLKIYRPEVTVTLVEANHRKAVFLREVLRALELNAEVKNVRAEQLPPASADLVTLRAVEKFESILPIAAGLVSSRDSESKVRGLGLLIGSGQIASARQILPDWRFRPEIPIPNSQSRVVQIVERSV